MRLYKIDIFPNWIFQCTTGYLNHVFVLTSKRSLLSVLLFVPYNGNRKRKYFQKGGRITYNQYVVS